MLHLLFIEKSTPLRRAEKRKGTICLDNPDKYGSLQRHERETRIYKVRLKISPTVQSRLKKRSLRFCRTRIVAEVSYACGDANSYVNEQFQRFSDAGDFNPDEEARRDKR